jgi:hypothetical protein
VRIQLPEQVIAASYDNNALRRVRSFSIQEFDATASAEWFRREFLALVAKHDDSYALFSQIGDILTCTWRTRQKTFAQLHDAFAIYQGSRVCLLEYVVQSFADPALEAALRTAVQLAGQLLNLLLLARITGSVEVKLAAAICAGLRSGLRGTSEHHRPAPRHRCAVRVDRAEHALAAEGAAP